jgi:uncharacterized membrane protein YesL
LALAVGGFVLLIPPIYAGTCLLAHKVYEHDEPSYLDVWRGFSGLYWRAVALGGIQVFGTAVIVANMLFYLSRSSAVFFLLAVLFGYILLFWCMNAVYHWPLLIASSEVIIRRDDERPATTRSILRNGLVLTLSAPGYAFVVTAILLLLMIPLVVSGVGLALLAPGIAAFLTTRSTRDHLTRFGLIPEEPDPDSPVVDERWVV